MPGNLRSAIAAYPRIAERDLQPGDIVFFQNTWWKGLSHVAIYIGGGRVISAENPRRGVNISALRDDPEEGSYWQHHYLTSERPLTAQVSTRPSAPASRSIGTAAVVVPSLNLRSGPSQNAGILAALRQGQSLLLKGHSGNWWEGTLPSGTSGWVIDAGIRVSLSTGSNWFRPWRNAPATDGRVAVEGLHSHSAPSFGAKVVATLHLDTTVLLLRQSNGWDQIALASGLRGWAVGWAIRTSRTPHKGRHGHRYRWYGVTPGATIHDGPSVSAPSQATTTPGLTVRVLARHGQFTHIQSSTGLQGCILSRFVELPERQPKAHAYSSGYLWLL
jgi:SH3-like domain-containing protein